MIAHPPSIYELFAGSVPILVQSLIAALFLVVLLAAVVRRELAVAGDGLVPPPKLTPRNFVELLLEGIASLMRDTIGPTWPKYLPLVGTLGLFILVANLMGLVPGLGGPTSFLETNFAWAMLSFGIAEYVSIREQGIGNYVSHLMGPIWWLAPIMLPIEIISHLSRLISLTLRLTGNMFADHTLVAVFLSFSVIQWVVPWIFMGLGLFVAFLQAFIFTFLTIIYIGQALEGAHHH
jgi:F-type H+-transporting ATPase subunit a